MYGAGDTGGEYAVRGGLYAGAMYVGGTIENVSTRASSGTALGWNTNTGVLT